ncbi:MAG: hypothetical protein HC932_01510 [Thermales bacterium]|nr:hypothetical protein [Thermales bacterium]
MKIQKFFRYFGYFSIILALITSGYLLGVRNKMDNQPNNIDTRSSNNYTQNSLSKIQTRDIFGAISPNQVTIFGQFYFKIVDNHTEILIKLNNIPENVKTDNQSKPIPNQLKISAATRAIDGLNYEYISLGTINMDEPINNLKSATFSTTIDPIELNKPALASAERIVLNLLTILRPIFLKTPILIYQSM